MIKSFAITNHAGEKLYLDIRKPEDTGFLVSSVTGLGPIKAEITENEYSITDGSEVSNVRLGSRNIVFNLVYFEDNVFKYRAEDIRHLSYKYFPVKRTIWITVFNDSGSYDISGVVESNEVNIFAQAEASQISIICPDPYFERSESNDIFISDVVPNFQFPVSFEAVIEDIPDPEEQEDIGLRSITDSEGNVYYEYIGPYTTVSGPVNDKLLRFAGKFSDHDVTVSKIPYSETENASGGLTVKIGESQ